MDDAPTPNAVREPAPAWQPALPLALTAGLALVLGTFGYVVVGFGVLTACTNANDCTRTTCAPCQAAQGWLGAGAIGQGLLLVVSVGLLVVAAVRPGARRRLAVAGWVLLTLSAAWACGQQRGGRRLLLSGC